MGREGHCKQISLACVGSAQCLGRTGFAPGHGMCAFPVYTSQALGYSVKELSEAGPGSHALPRSKPLRFRYSSTPQRCRLSWACILCPSQIRSEQLRRPDALRAQSSQVGSACYHFPSPSHSVSWVAAGAPVSGVPCISSGELISDCDPPGRCQPSGIPRSLGEQLEACFHFSSGCHSGAKIAPF